MRSVAVVVCLVVYGVSGPSNVEAQLRIVTYASGFSAPIAFEQDPSDPAMQYVAEITGGYVYRGMAIPAVRGRYFFADYATRRVWSLNLRVNTHNR